MIQVWSHRARDLSSSGVSRLTRDIFTNKRLYRDTGFVIYRLTWDDWDVHESP
jgi:hypothetical protein